MKPKNADLMAAQQSLYFAAEHLDAGDEKEAAFHMMEATSALGYELYGDSDTDYMLMSYPIAYLDRPVAYGVREIYARLSTELEVMQLLAAGLPVDGKRT